MRAALAFLARGVPGLLVAALFWYGWMGLAWLVFTPVGGR